MEDNMEVSDVSLGDWDVVSSASLENEVQSEEEGNEDVPEDIMSCNESEDMGEEEIVRGSAVEVIEQEYSPHYDSSSSSGSDVDVIDENLLDYGHSNASLSPTLDMSLTSSGLEQTLNRIPIVATTPEVGSPPVVLSPVMREERDSTISFRAQALAILSFFIITMFITFDSRPMSADSLRKLEVRVIELEAENKELRDHMLSKVGDDKLLEKQITALKDENNKVSIFMQDLIDELEQQNIVFKKGEGKTLEQDEIDKLKEQVNILKIDNDELQKQLVRMRYGVYSPSPENDKGFDKRETEKPELNELENDTEILPEEFKRIRRMMLSEVAKLSEWKKSVHVLMKGLESGNKKSSDPPFPKPRGQKNKKGNRYDKMFKDINDQLAEAVNNIPRLNLTELVQKYMGVDKKKVKSVFDSVGHFFKKAQEKTKDIYDENIKSDMWSFIGSFRKQWHVLRKSFYENSKKHNPNKGRVNEKGETNFNAGKNEKNVPMEDETTKNFRSLSIPAPERPREEFQKQKRGEATISRDSWVFERAAHRSEIRDNQNEEEEVNWFLKNKKTSDTPNYFSMDENDDESESYEPKDMFSME